MSRKQWCRSVPSLLTISTDYFVQNLPQLQNEVVNMKSLPNHVKNKMLRQFTSCTSAWRKLNLKPVLSALVHPGSKHVNLTAYTVDDEVVDILKVCTDLQRLYLTSVGKHSVTSKGLVSLFPHLKKLYIVRLSNCSSVNDEVIISLASHCPDLAGFDIDGCTNVTDASLNALAPLKNLQWLSLSKTKISDLGLTKLISGPSGLYLKELRLAECLNVTENVLSELAYFCPELEVLVFCDCKKTQENTYFSFGAGSLKNLKQLTWTVQW